MHEWHQMLLHEARAQGLKSADYTKPQESLGGRCIRLKVISCQTDLSFVFDLEQTRFILVNSITNTDLHQPPLYFSPLILCLHLPRNYIFSRATQIILSLNQNLTTLVEKKTA